MQAMCLQLLIDNSVAHIDDTFLEFYPQISWREAMCICSLLGPNPTFSLQTCHPSADKEKQCIKAVLFFSPFTPILRKSTVNDSIMLWNAGRKELSFFRAFLTSDKNQGPSYQSTTSHFKAFFCPKFLDICEGKNDILFYILYRKNI